LLSLLLVVCKISEHTKARSPLVWLKRCWDTDVAGTIRRSN
jgi:hypothetical protein